MAPTPKPKIYKSPYPPIPLPTTDLISFLFTTNNDDDATTTTTNTIPPSYPIYIDGLTGTTRTYADMHQRTKSLAAGLRSSKLGVQPGDIVALFSPNTVDYAITCFAIIGCGATVSPVNAASTALELRSQLCTSGAKFLIVHSSLLATAMKAAERCPDLKTVIQADGLSSSSSTSSTGLHASVPTAEYLATHTAPAELVTVSPAEARTRVAIMCFSSGTTGAAKGVMTSHFNMTSNVLQWQHHASSPPSSSSSSSPSSSSAINEQTRPGQTFIAFLPFSHIYGFQYMICQPVKFGCTAVVMPRFELPLYLSLAARYKVETLSLVPPVILGMLNSGLLKKEKYDLSSVNTMVSAAAPLSPELAGAIERKFEEVYGTTVHVLQAWGLTETSPLCATMPSGAPWVEKRKDGSVGNLTPNVELRIVDPDTMEDVSQDPADTNISRPGELWVRGPNVCLGYYRNESATKNGFAVDEQGRRWFRTGDIGAVDRDGFVRIVDRMKEMIKYKGFQVIPSELEAMLLEHPDVEDACVVGVYVGSLATELPVGFVVLRRQAVNKRSEKFGSEETAEKRAREELRVEVKEWLEAKVAGHKKFRGGLFAVEGVPKSPSGKILRRQLKLEWEGRVKEMVEGSSSKL